MFDEARKAIKESSKSSSIYIGCDSKRFKKNEMWYARYSTVIILHRDSKHGCNIFHKQETIPDFGNLKQRLLTETMYAINAAIEIIDVAGDRKLEVHLDINSDQKHKSNVAVKEALGYVKGTLGLDAVVKPNAFAATTCADYLVQ